MTFKKNNITYRVAFDVVKNHFMAIDLANEENVAYGVTIEKAIAALTFQK